MALLPGLSSLQTDRTPFFGVGFERTFLRTIRLAFVAVGLYLAQNMSASAACVILAGTADGFDKETAVSRAKSSLEAYIQQYKAENREHDVPSRYCG